MGSGRFDRSDAKMLGVRNGVGRMDLYPGVLKTLKFKGTYLTL